MRIGVDIKSLVAGRPGISAFVLRLLRDAAAANHHAHEFVLFGPPPALEAAQHGGLSTPCFQQHPVPLRERLGKFRLPFYDQLELPAALARARLDLFFCPYVDAPLAGRIPVILTVHDSVLVRLSRLYPLHVRTYLNSLCRVHLRRARRIVTVSNFSKQELLRDFRAPAEKICVLPGAIPPAFLRAAPEAEIRALRLRLGLGSEYVLYTGGADPRKNLPRLFAAFQRLNGARRRAVLTITGEASAFARYRQQWEQCGLANDLVFTGQLTEPELAAVYRGAALVVYPSLWEGCGLPLLEAVACDTPIAASNCSSLPEAGGEAAVYFNPEDADDMARVMHRVLTDGSVRAHLRAAAARRRQELLRAQPGRVFLQLCEAAVAERHADSAGAQQPAQHLAPGQD